MKSKFLKMFFPAFAIVLAITLSSATVANETFQTGYYDDPFIPGVQQVPGGTSCITTSGDLCQYNGYTVYQESALANPYFKR